MTTCNKPNLKGFHNATIKRNLIGMGISVVIVGTIFYFNVNKPRKQNYANFYKEYDFEKSAEKMRDAGLLQSTPPLPSDQKAKQK